MTVQKELTLPHNDRPLIVARYEQQMVWEAILKEYQSFGELLGVKLYDKTPVTYDKYLMVIYKETSELDGFILTAYFSRGINKKRRIVWKP